MNQAAALIGKGHFSERIPVSGSDEIGQLSATFNRMAEQLESLESMRKELISNVSHELRTPLTSVRGFVQAILEGMVPAGQQRKYLEFMYQELNRLSGLLNSMLDLSAMESGRIRLQMRKIRWSSLVETVSEGFQLRMEEKGIAFRVVEPDDIRLTVYGDSERLKQVLFNLLDNAIRHTPEGGRIEVQSRPAGNCVEVRIADTGAGIDPAELPYIWERFYTGDASRLSRRERSGLGLTITKQLVELMGGTIGVTSELGAGTTFTLRLPSEGTGSQA
jgi:signal transduction histidine kinase